MIRAGQRWRELRWGARGACKKVRARLASQRPYLTCRCWRPPYQPPDQSRGPLATSLLTFAAGLLARPP
jgi:hypothetical protein